MLGDVAASMLRVAVSVASSGVTTPLIVTPLPVTTRAAPRRFVPVSVSGTVAPTSPAAGSTVAMVGGGRCT